jgi:DNA-directed RNA polymerase I subunit RPA43
MSVADTATAPPKAKKQKLSKKTESKSEKKKRKHKSESVENAPPEHPHSKRRKSGKYQKNNKSSRLKENESDNSPFFQETLSLYLPLSPISQLRPLEGLCAEHLSPLILTYYPPLNGVLLSYCNVYLSDDISTPRQSNAKRPDNEGPDPVLALSVDEYAVSFLWVTADFLVFKPQRGGWIEGWVNLQDEGHLGLVCWNLFNASIERKRLPEGWTWVPSSEVIKGTKARLKKGDTENGDNDTELEDSGKENSEESQSDGHFEDEDGNRIGSALRFRVIDVDTSLSVDRDQGFLSIKGTMLHEAEEAETAAQEIAMENTRRGAFTRLVDMRLTGALKSG